MTLVQILIIALVVLGTIAVMYGGILSVNRPVASLWVTVTGVLSVVAAFTLGFYQ
jgi:hypothetical protein